MIAIVIFVLIGFIVGHKISGINGAWRIFLTLTLGGMGFITGTLIAYLIGVLPLSSEYVVTEKIELVALQDTGGIRGEFFLGSGSIESEFYYVFYKKTKNGSIKFDKIQANNAVSIWEEERKDGKIDILKKKFKSKFGILFALSETTKYEIFIPKSSILKNFQLDLK